MEQAGARTEDLLRQGIAAARAKRKAEAYQILSRVVEQSPRSEQGWVWLAAVAPSAEESLRAFERVLEINPANEQAQIGRRWAQSRIGRAGAAPQEGETPGGPAGPGAAHAAGATPPPGQAGAIGGAPGRPRGTAPLAGDYAQPAEPAQASRRQYGTAPLSPERVAPPEEAPPTPWPGRQYGTAPLSPERAAGQEVSGSGDVAGRAVTPGSDLTSEQFPGILEPAPRVPVRPGGTGFLFDPDVDEAPAAGPPAGDPRDDETRPVHVDALRGDLTFAPAGAAPASDTGRADAHDWLGLDELRPKEEIDWDAPGSIFPGPAGIVAIPGEQEVACANCGYGNDPSAIVCARCNAPLLRADAPPVVVAGDIHENASRVAPGPGPRTAVVDEAPAAVAVAEPQPRPREIIAPVPIGPRSPFLPLLIGLGVVIAGLAIAVLGINMLGRSDTPEQAAQAFFDSYFSRNREAASQWLAEDLAFQYANGEIPALQSYPTMRSWKAQVQPLAVSPDGEQVEVMAFIREAEQDPAAIAATAYTLRMARSDGRWRIEEIRGP